MGAEEKVPLIMASKPWIKMWQLVTAPDYIYIVARVDVLPHHGKYRLTPSSEFHGGYHEVVFRCVESRGSLTERWFVDATRLVVPEHRRGFARRWIEKEFAANLSGNTSIITPNMSVYPKVLMKLDTSRVLGMSPIPHPMMSQRVEERRAKRHQKGNVANVNINITEDPSTLSRAKRKITI